MHGSAREGASPPMRDIEASLEAFVEQHSLASFVLGTDLRVVASTASLHDLIGAPGRRRATTLADLLPEQACTTLERQARQILDAGGVWQGMIRSSDDRNLGARLEAAESATGRREFVLATLVDMSRVLLIVRQIEELNVALQYRVAELAATLDFAPAGIVICEDPEGRVVRANRRAAEFFDVDVGRNLSRHRSVPEPVDVLIEPHGDSLSLDRYLLDRARRKTRRDETVALRCPNGDVVHVSMAVAPLVDQAGELRGAIGSFTDVTELKRVTEEAGVRARQQAAMARLALYAVNERSPDKIIKRVLEACTSTLGVKYCKVLELDREHDILRLKAGKGWKRGRVGHALVSADRDGSPDGLALHSHRTVVVDDFAAETRFTDRKLFEDHMIVGGASVVIESGDGPWGVLGAHTDRKREWSQDDLNFVQAMAALLSTALQRRDFEERLTESEAQLTMAEKEERLRRTARLASLGTLAAGIAHEINNPLNSMLMNAELGQMVARNLNGGQGGARIEELFARIVDDCRRCAGITSGVLQFARSDDGPKESGDINRVLQSSKELLASILPLYDMRCELELLEPAPPVALNETELEQALVNLMRNAAEAGASELRILSRLDGDHLVISLRDNGPGIARESFGRLFDPFFSTRREQGGTGLGLSLVHRIVHDHGGTVSGRNVADNGAQFDIRLPIDWRGNTGD
ncbi:MAG TPA: ATP-binding protein [Gammaproteobacteria bacterium]|nr:ATP-binding protein [Gammaproteobacteria bacterium]